MSPEPSREFVDALAALCRALAEAEARWMIIGGVAVIALGVPRLTVDIDATVSAQALDVDRLVEALGRHAIQPRIPDAVAFARARQVFLSVHEPSGTPVDVSLAWLPFEDEALAASTTCDYAGVAIRIPRPEDLVIYKVIASRPKDLQDAEGLLVLHAPMMDLGRVRRVVKQYAEVLEDDKRPKVLERLIRKVGG